MNHPIRRHTPIGAAAFGCGPQASSKRSLAS